MIQLSKSVAATCFAGMVQAGTLKTSFVVAAAEVAVAAAAFAGYESTVVYAVVARLGDTAGS